MNVTKRDGRQVPFNKSKVKLAILKAFLEVDGEETPYAKEKAREIANYVESLNKDMNVEEIQDIVVGKLMGSARKDVATKYIEYRYLHSMARSQYQNLIKAISEKLTASNVQNQNANVDEHSFGGRMGEANDIVMKQYALDYCMSDMAKNNHLNNEIYIHDLNSYAVGMHNCAKRSTRFITKYGVYSFEDFKNGDVISVLTHTGKYREATVHSYGEQKLNKITFARCGIEESEYFTPDHRWLLADGTITTSLSIGDKLIKAPDVREFDFDSANQFEQYFWCLGFILGDGTNAVRWSHGVKHDDVKFVRLRLCGDKVKYESRFSNLKHNTKEMDNGDLYLTFSSTIGLVKKFPDIHCMSLSEKHALFDGLYCADGQKVGNRKSILTTDEQIASFIEDEAPSFGYYITHVIDKTGEKTNYTTRNFTKEFIFTGDNNKYYWTVTSIEKHETEEVWCLDVPEDHSFVLPNGIVTGNCLSIPFDDLLANGFNTRQTDVRPAQSINTAFQLVAVIFQIQSLQQFGGVSATHLDWTMVPYVRKSFAKHFKDGVKYVQQDYDPNRVPNELSFNDPEANDYLNAKAYQYAMDMTKREAKQAVEGMYHNLNTLQSRSGNQLPFSSINYGTCTLPEGRMITEALLNASIEGTGRLHKTSIFPCGIFQCMKGVNRAPGDPNYDLFQLALKSTALRLYPNYANVDWSNNAGYDKNDPRTYFSTMGCRTANLYDVNGLEQLKDGRGNICPVTIILPTLAMEAKNNTCGNSGSKEDNIACFMALLNRKLYEAKDMLLERFEWICSQSPDAAKFMYENNVMAGYIPEEGIRSALKHGTLAIGQLGLAETLQILIGCDHTTEEGMELAKRIEQLFKDRCAEFKKKYSLNFGVYYTPAENLCYTAMKKFKSEYGEIPNVSDKDFFTNSMHVPVWKDIDPFEKIDIESQLTGYSSAGCITYVELESSAKHNIEALETIVNYAMDHDIPYFAINVPNDTCMDCGYCDEIDNECPICGGTNIQRLRRVTGYLTGNYTTAFNKGKRQEVELRTKHSKSAWR